MKHAHIMILLLTAMIAINSNSLETYGYQSPCGSHLDYTIDTDTIWQDETICANNITVGNSTQRIIFSITNTTVYMKDRFYMGGDNPSNVTINSSTIYFESDIGTNASIPIGYINTSQYITMDDTTDKSSPSMLEIRDSTIRGINYTHRFSGMKIYSYGLGILATHTLILDNVNISYAGGNNQAGSGYYGVDAVTSDAPWYLSNSSRFNMVKIYYCGKGLYLPSNMNMTNSISYGGVMPFRGGILWDNLTIINSTEPYEPSDGGIVRNSYFTCNFTKLDVPYTASNAILEYSRIYNSALNAGDGTWSHEGQSNIVRHCYIEQSGVGSRKNNTQYINLTLNSSCYEASITIGGHHQLVENSTIIGMGHASGIKLYMHESTPSYNGKQTGTIIRNTLINDTHYGIRIENANNGTFDNIDITNMNMLYSKGFPDGYGLYIRNSSNLRFIDINMSGGFYGPGGGVYATKYMTLNTDNRNLTFESCSFDSNMADMSIDTQNLTMTYLDINTPQGTELINLTLENNTVNTGNITITFPNLEPANIHFIKKDSIYYWNTSGWTTEETRLYPNTYQNLSFTNSDWSIHTFTLEEIHSPNITAWYTNATNASTSQDTMFLTPQGEDILFNVTVDNNTPTTYEWTVNKILRQESGPEFIFSVPESNCTQDPTSCIWEIHLTINNTYEVNHKEWLISNLTIEQAPTIFESFTDASYQSRTEPDPWGRNATEWTSRGNTISNMSTYYLKGYKAQNLHLMTESEIVYGTWDFYFRYPNGGNNLYGDSATIWYASNGTSDDAECYYRWIDPSDEHVWIDYICNSIRCALADIAEDTTSSNSGCISNGTACQSTGDIGIGPAWHHVRLIHDKRTGYHWNWIGLETVEEPFIPESMEYMDELTNSDYLGIRVLEDGALTSGVYSTTDMDFLTVYNETYIYPQKTLSYNSTSSTITIQNGLDPEDLWSLEDISDTINNETLFSYNQTTKTAYMNANNLVFDFATGFRIEGETLIFNGSSPSWTWKSGLYMKILNSTIRSNGRYLTIRSFPEFTLRGRSNGLNSGYIDIIGSRIMNIYGPDFSANEAWLDHVNISNTYFKFNKTSSVWNGRFQFSTSSRYDYDVTMNNNTYDIVSGLTYKNMLFAQYATPTFYNSVFLNNIMFGYWRSTSTLVNCYIEELDIEPPYQAGEGGELMVKYYLDVIAKDQDNNPLGNITVRIRNELDESTSNDIEKMLHPNSHWYWYDNAGGTEAYHRRVTTETENEASTFTTEGNGHTPTPGWEKETIILMDYKRNDTYQTEYTYTVEAYDQNNIRTNVTQTIYPNNTVQQLTPLAQISGIDPNETWYRPNPNTPTYTVELEIPSYHGIANMSVATGESMNITINYWRTKSKGINVNFTAESIDGNNVNFTVCNLTESADFLITKDSEAYPMITSDASGCISFNNSEWTGHEFIIEQIGLEYYLSTQGNDLNNGISIASAWGNLSYACSQIEAGDILYIIDDGTYYNHTCTLANAGTENHPITMTAYNGTPTFNGNNLTTAMTIQSHTEIKGLNIENYGSAIYSNTGTNINITRNTIIVPPKIISSTEVYKYGVYLVDTLNSTISSNTVIMQINSESLAGVAGCAGIWLSGNNSYITNNTVTGHAHNSINLVGQTYENPESEISSHLYVRYNHISNNSVHGGMDIAGDIHDLWIEDNTFYAASPLYTHKQINGTYRLHFNNNTIISAQRADFMWTRDSIASGNRVYNSTGDAFYSYVGDISSRTINLTLSNNYFENTTGYTIRLSSRNNPDIGRGNLTLHNNNGTYLKYVIEGNTTKGILQFTTKTDKYNILVGGWAQASIEYLNNHIFNITKTYGYEPYEITYPKWTPTKSYFDLEALANSGIGYNVTSYPIAVTPTNDYLNISISQIDQTTDTWEITVKSSETENPTTFTLETLYPDTIYTVMRDSETIGINTTDDSGILTYTYSSAGDDWTTAHDFEFIRKIATTLNSPEDNTFTNNNTIVFNCSADTENRLTNITLWGNWTEAGEWHANETKDVTGTRNSTIFEKILPVGEYIWNCRSFDNESISAFGSENHTFKIDQTEPNISISSPANNTQISYATQATIIIATDENATCRYNTTTPDFNYTSDTESMSFTTTAGTTHTMAINVTPGSTQTLYYKCRDLAGNTDTNSTMHTFSVSSTPPTSSSGGGSSSSTGSSSGGGAALPAAPTLNDTEDSESDNSITGDTIIANTTDRTNTDDMKAQAKALIDEVKAIIGQYSGIRYLEEAESRLNQAIEAYDAEDYERAITLARDAKELALGAEPLKTQATESESASARYILYASITIIIIGMIIFILKKHNAQKPDSESITGINNPAEELEIQKRKLDEIESYIIQIRPIVNGMIAENQIGPEFEQMLNNIEDNASKAKNNINNGYKNSDEDIQSIIDSISRLKQEIEKTQ